MQQKYLSTKKLVMVSLLIALNIVIVRFISIQTPIVRIGFGFIPTALCSMLFGPVWGAASAFLADFLGMVINSHGMTYFPGFGINEALYGLTYALFLYKREKSYKNIILCVVLQGILINSGLGTLWATILYHNPVWTTLLTRSVNMLVMIPIKVIMIKYIWEFVGKYVWNRVLYSGAENC